MQKLFLVKLEGWMEHEIPVIETSDNFWYMWATESLKVSGDQFIRSQSPKAQNGHAWDLMVLYRSNDFQEEKERKLSISLLAHKYLPVFYLASVQCI